MIANEIPKMVVDSIKKLFGYFSKSKETESTTMNAVIVSNNEAQSLYSIVENCLKENVSTEYKYFIQSSAQILNYFTNLPSVILHS